jgi:hypothetical protein
MFATFKSTKFIFWSYSWSKLSTLSGFNSLESKAGLSTGFFSIIVTSHFGIGAQVLYSELGAKFKNSDEDLNLDYVQIPVLATYYFGSKQTTGLWRPKVFAGPQIGFLTSVPKRRRFESRRSLLQQNRCCCFGCRCKLCTQSKNVVEFDARYGLGLTDVAKSSNCSKSCV